MKKTVVLILLLLLTSVWSNVRAGLYDNQSRVVVSSTELTLCTPGTFLLGNYELAFPKADSTTNLQLEYFDMLNCYAQQANLTLLPSSFITEPTYDTICAGESYTWNGNTYTKPGTYTDTLQNIYGCDSIVTLHLEVLPDPPLTFTVNGVSFKMRRVRAGTFMMGATPEQGTDALPDEKPAHQVTLTRDYFMAETMLTQELWTAVMGTTIQEEEAKGSGDTGLGYGANYPMYCISYYDCLNFVERLNQLTGLTFRIPTEAEWEYAARGGHLSRGYKYPGSNDPHEVAWNVSKDSNKKLHEVKQLLPNELGLYDMAGNTWEWIFDYNRQYKEQSQTDPIGDTTSNYAFIRGGSSYYSSSYNRVSCRGKEYNKTFKANRIAFRFVLDADRVIGEDNTTYQAYDTICAGETYEWNGEKYTESGTYTKTLQNIYGCDSVVTLHLEINQTQYAEETITTCDNYTWNAQTYTESGNYTYTTTAANGCDSITTLHLTINKTVYAEETVTACDSYDWNGQTYTESGNYTYTTTAANGCDSITTLHLTINYRDTAFFTETACDSYEWHNQVYNVSGTYYYHTQTVLGCDSVEVLNLTINYRDTAFFTETACDSYTWHDQVYNVSGTYYYNTQTMLGCDSVEVLNLTINYRDTAFFTETACDSYTWHDQVYNTSGTYYYTTQTVLGCDSVEVLNLTINYRDTVFFTQTACDIYEWHGDVYTESGTYYYHTQTIYGCDSVEVMRLTILPPTKYFATDTFLCYGEVCDWRGVMYYESGIYHDTIRNILNCDSLIYTLNLVISPEIPITHIVDTMAGAEYHWNDQIYTHGGDYTVTLPAITGCDSVVILHLMDNYAAIDTVIVYEQCAGSGEQEVEILTQGFIEEIVLKYSPQAQAAGLRDTVMPLSSINDIYTIYYDSVCAGVHEVTAVGLFHGVEVASYTFTLTYLYPNTIFEQRYNDLIAVLTHDYNGGYDFSAFQWYKDGVLLPGETHSYLNQSLSFESEYSVLLTNTDGLQLMSCPIIAEDKSELSVYPTILKQGELVNCHLTNNNALYIHDATGKVIQELQLEEGTTAVALPAVSGVYLLRFVSNDHIERTFKVIVQ